MAATNKKYSKPVYLVDGSRTPFLKARGRPGPFKHADLGIYAARSLLLRMPFDATEFDEVIFGSTMPGPDEANIARIVALRLGCGDQVPAFLFRMFGQVRRRVFLGHMPVVLDRTAPQPVR